MKQRRHALASALYWAGAAALIGAAAWLLLELKPPPHEKVDLTRHRLERVGLALHLYRLDHGVYPPDEPGLAALVRADARGPYLDSLKALQDGWGRPLVYHAKDGRTQFELLSLGADGVRGGGGPGQDISLEDVSPAGSGQATRGGRESP